MTISFNEIPDGGRAPLFFVEFDTSKAQQGPSIQQYSALLIGQKLSSGTKPSNQRDRITSESQARNFYGPGSMLAKMAAGFLKDNKTTSLTCIALDDDGGAVAAEATLTITGPATADGTLSVMVAGKRYRVAVADEDTATDIAAALVAEITADDDREVNVGNVIGVVTFTHRNKGEAGNQIDLRINPFEGEDLPEGVGATPTAFTSGSANPDITDAIVAMGEIQFNVIGHPYTDAANLTAFETEMADRFGPVRQNDGVGFTAKRDSFANLITLGDGRNSGHNSIMGISGPSTPWLWAADIAAVLGKFGQIDPARPFQTLGLTAVIAPNDDEQFTYEERDMLLKDGISTFRVAAGGNTIIDRMITTFQENALGAPDTSLLNVNTLLTLSFLRFDFRTQFQNTYPRHKLANDGTLFGEGQKVITPKVAKAKAIAIFRDWETAGLVEGIDQFKRDLIVERNEADPDRLDFLLPPDLINAFRIGAAQIAFLL